MKPLLDCRLYTFVDTAYLRGRPPEAVARALCDGGSDVIQLRAKQLPVDDVRRMAAAILPVTRGAGVGLVINDYPAIAAELGADLCHLGQEDFFEAGHRKTGVHRGGAGLCDRHETRRKAGDAGVREMGGRERDAALVCHWWN
jgi:thiamine monophosphate synthase